MSSMVSVDGAIRAPADAAVVEGHDGVAPAQGVDLRTPAFADDPGALHEDERRPRAFTDVVDGGVGRLKLFHGNRSMAKTAKIA